jgi:hypothetical protein
MREFCGTTPLLDEPDSTATLKLVDYTHVVDLACRARRAGVNRLLSAAGGPASTCPVSTYERGRHIVQSGTHPDVPSDLVHPARRA